MQLMSVEGFWDQRLLLCYSLRLSSNVATLLAESVTRALCEVWIV